MANSRNEMISTKNPQWSLLCSRCKSLKVHGSVSELSSGNESLTAEKLKNGIKDNCALCNMMIEAIPSSNNIFFTPNIKSDSADSPLHHLEAYTSPTGHFVFSAEEGDPAADILHRRPPLTDYNSDAAYSLISSWISDCSNSHKTQNILSSPCPCEPMHAKPVPRRLIDVGSATEDPSLVVPDPGTLALYAALSYCWGLQQPVTLKTAMLKGGLPSFPIHELPATLRDAIIVCRKLGFRYIWIDALCIIQDSPSGEDWIIESGTMDRVYGNAAITIAASAAKDSSVGMLHNFPVARQQDSFAIVPYHLGDGRLGKAFIHFHPYEIASSQPLANRAWTLQESLLSPRILSYQSNQLSWKCKQGRLYSSTPADTARKSLDSMEWRDVVYQFTSRKMTFSTDRLAALSGYAKFTSLKAASSSSEITEPPSSYIAGLWSDSLLHDLLWRRSFPCLYRPKKYRAPSWSWASIDSPVHFVDRGPITHSKLEIIDVSVAVSSIDPFGSLNASPPSYIKLRGQIKCAAGLPVTLLRGQRSEASEFTVDCYQGPAGRSQGHNLFGVNFDTLETAQGVFFYLEKPQQNADAIYFTRSCPLYFLRVTDIQALAVVPTAMDGLHANEHVFLRVGILNAIYTTLGSFGTWFHDVEEPTIVTLV